ncbi:MAG TPA: metal ABC transporter permease [Gammaproteobacteria bacterium]|nr:metal ABC transporter permease [Gammaproteobacteria bacterium]
MSFVHALMDQPFLSNALLAGLLAGIGCGLVGPFVIVKRIGYLAGGVAHSVLGGMGIAYFFGGDPLLGATVGAVVSALVIGWVSIRWRAEEDTLIGALWAGGMATGILFISLAPGYKVDLLSYLFGNILLVGPRDLWLMAGLDVGLAIVVGVFYRQFLAVCFDEEFARIRGVAVTRFYLLLLVMVALTVVLLLQVVGLIMVIAMLTLPAAIAAQWLSSVARMIAGATVIAVLVTWGGLALSYAPDLPAGSVIVLLAVALYLVSSLVSARRRT